MSRFINPYSDYGFKLLFGREVSKDLLIDFLNGLLVGERVITDLTFLNNEQLPEYQEGRGIIYDVYCTTDTGEKIIVEMQNRSQVNFKDRALFYLSKAVVNQGLTGSDWMFGVKAVYGVFFMNFLLDGEEQKLRTDVILADRETGKIFSDKLRQIFIALPLFDKDEEECENDFERWIYVLKNMETLERMPFKARKAVFERLEELADVGALSKHEREVYDNSLKVYRDYLVTMEAAKIEGREEGRVEGRVEGIEIGIKKSQTDTALRMKSKGMSVSEIADITGLTLTEIEALQA
ncbi:Rpn family recombination-promoting nuclease/putative transposase [Bacteroides helcogenes]|uniref:Rpn family recombination-promoting nuclease/putative transposase n=1 Tax=Bacteroides helcogenes (strain ATCC 35417 / DSM 20613 / JCM 6297 / CCUG 15421 / P 36-108) TaxID=693979 RepID=E6SPP8_BACT6|nr:Rpn family recombination-promoting nuclease/putative transposase [Bacteroides helcogenes]ADV43889.1 hypothetical protein Bache_1911 [Bacteroides helcogenes P 36-108]MDY5237517.1 Rpn family recombination-promoting nuclease/putative transposase [Bacteroides helcogenes]